jgi:transcriptional enhancer factor
VKPFQSGAFCLAVPKVTPPAPPPAPAWLGRSIATQRLRILEHSAFVDQQRDQDTYHKHLFVHIGSSVDYSDPLLEVSLVPVCVTRKK